ncbi:biotin transporter BioY [Rothia kristinae]|uniref:Biotin transporter n=1 Tax=Rothia kristinae TaxID=37923 RepID=A0A7T4T4D2_9MICC|nr:biotin transporter BioY [Rothia kristinae]QQC59460.1 biotin transporter BioY [Rothia kristinae]
MSQPAARRRRSTLSPAHIIARVAVFAALIAVLGLMAPIPVPGIPVPITAQTLGVMLAGAVLGPVWGAASVTLFELLVIVGLPLLSGGRGGIGVFAGVSGGYLIGYIAGAFVVGLIALPRAGRPSWIRVLLASLIGGIAVIYLFGVPVQAWRLGIGLRESLYASFAFLPGDIIKAVLTTLITAGLWKAYPRAFLR